MMPKAKNPLTPQEQMKRFEEEVRKRIDAGELSPTEADAALDKLVRKSRIGEP
jgi:hypothetical protein